MSDLKIPIFNSVIAAHQHQETVGFETRLIVHAAHMGARDVFHVLRVIHASGELTVVGRNLRDFSTAERLAKGES